MKSRKEIVWAVVGSATLITAALFLGCSDGGTKTVTEEVEVCPASQIKCGNICIDPDTDRAYCGASGDCQGANAGTECADGEVCNGAGSCDLSCQAGLTECEGECVNLLTDRRYCSSTGSCGDGCLDGFVCDGAGNCELSCQAGLVECDGKCVDTNYHPDHCGSCTSCPAVPNATKVCVGGSCGYVCDTGYADCNLNPADGCEINVLIDDENCGVCGNVCSLAGCSNGDCPKVVFVSSMVYDGNMGGLSGANANCQALADAEGLEGTFMAWLSDSTGSPSSLFNLSSGPYVLVDGTKVADDWDDLVDGTLDNPINLTENGVVPPLGTDCSGGSSSVVWTATDADGTASSGTNCVDWSSNSGGQNGDLGYYSSTDSNWTYYCSGSGCDTQSPIYCFEQ